MWQDPVILETRKLREEYAAKFGDDSEAMFQDIIKRQVQHKERLVSFQPRKPRLSKGVVKQRATQVDCRVIENKKHITKRSS